MIKRILLSVILIFVIFVLVSCQTAEGIKGDVTFIGDKTTEILDK
jgi:predicted small secreted protein